MNKKGLKYNIYNKRYPVECPKCKQTRTVCYDQFLNLKKGRFGMKGYCMKCSHQNTWNKGKTKENNKSVLTTSLKLKGRKMQEYQRKLLSKAHLGKKHSEEHKLNISRAKKGTTQTKEHKLNISKAIKKLMIQKPVSDETKKRISLAQTGEKNNNWKGGITIERQRIMNSMEYKNWRTSVFERDNYVCQECGDRSGNGYTVVLNADHIKPFAYFPKLRFDLNNGQTLCVPCHKETDTYAYKSIKKYQYANKQ